MSETADRIRAAATRLFAERGFAGTSVRAICQAADTNINAVSYHFGGKQALYKDIIGRMGDDRLASAQRLLGHHAEDVQDLNRRLLLFAEETLAAHLKEPDTLVILYAESQQLFRNCDPSTITDLTKHNQVLIEFLQNAQNNKLICQEVDVHIMAGTLIERLNNQVHFADLIESTYGTSIKESTYRQHWVNQTINLLLFGSTSHQE